jgi:nicotinamidase-related amidase
MSAAAVTRAIWNMPPESVVQMRPEATLKIDSERTAVLAMDFQQDIVTGFVPTDPSLLERTARVLDAARGAALPVIHVVIHFRPGYPEVPPRGMFQMVRTSNRLAEGTPGAAVHAAVAPKPGDIVVVKKRVGAFSGSDLDCVLRGLGRSHLVLCGVATSGVVLSTVRTAADLDYEMNVIADCCADRDEEVHRVLTQKVFATMAPPVSAADFIEAVGRKP